MNRLKILACGLACVICSSQSFAGEPDLWTCRTKVHPWADCKKPLIEINDSVDFFDSWVNDRIDEWIDVASRKLLSPERAIYEAAYVIIGERKPVLFQKRILMNSAVEDWHKLHGLSLPYDSVFVRQNSIYELEPREHFEGVTLLSLFQGYAKTGKGLLAFFGGEDAEKWSDNTTLDIALMRVLKIAGVLMGDDKVSHFFAQGYQYVDTYIEALKSGANEQEALDAVRRKGHDLEFGLQGGGAAGFYSFADLASNWQGFRFYHDLTLGENPFAVQLEDGTWERTDRVFSFSEYVTDEWDEVNAPFVHLQKKNRKSGLDLNRDFMGVFRTVVSENFCDDYRESPETYLNLTGRRLGENYLQSPDVDSVQTYQKFHHVEQICDSH